MGLYGKRYKVEDVSVRAFMALTVAGLWGRLPEGFTFRETVSGAGAGSGGVELEDIDWEAVLQLAREQALVGIIASAFDAGEGESAAVGLGFELEEVLDKAQRKAFAKKVYSLEQRNLKMDRFVLKLFRWLEDQGLHPILLKGQGIAKSYRNTLRRTPGDVDVLLMPSEYEVAKNLLIPKASKLISQTREGDHVAFVLKGFIVELHSNIHVFLDRKTDAAFDSLMEDIFAGNKMSSIGLQVFDEDAAYEVHVLPVSQNVLYVFCHLLQHFFSAGIGLRQVCDLARLLYVHGNELDTEWLGTQIEKFGIMDEWNAFGALMVEYLGLPYVAMPKFGGNAVELGPKWSRKARLILCYILSVGNMGHNRDVTYKKKYSYIVRKTISLSKLISNAFRLGRIFPKDVARISFNGISEAIGRLEERK